MNELTPQQMKSLDEMVQRRMDNTKETFDEAKSHIINYFERALTIKQGH
tara:strand:- start:905 stop:1051 length:147 start_codon:yes stop_codon:yes gene_type:complete